MQSPIWTPAALSSEAAPFRGSGWRLVEAQHRVSTLKLVDDLDEQAVLEDLIEATKPSLPPDCRRLDYLFATPFRYGAPYPHGSRFRRAGWTAGVYYAAESARTAVAEMAFHRLLFFANSPETPWPREASEYTAFSASLATGHGLDLTRAPFDRDAVGLDPSNRIWRLSGLRRRSPRRRRRPDSLPVGPRSRQGRESGGLELPGLCETEAAGEAGVANPARPDRRAGPL